MKDLLLIVTTILLFLSSLIIFGTQETRVKIKDDVGEYLGPNTELYHKLVDIANIPDVGVVDTVPKVVEPEPELEEDYEYEYDEDYYDDNNTSLIID